MSRSKQSVEESIINWFNDAPQASVDIVFKLATGIVRRRFAVTKVKSVNKKANKVASSVASKKSHVEESVSQE
jgi:hypothetical protein